MNKLPHILLYIFLYILFSSCEHELENPKWEVDMITPIAYTELNINNILSDSNVIINENEEGLISLIFEEEFITMNLDTLIKIDAIADEKTHTLDSASFADVTISDTATIGEAIMEIPGGTLLLPDGSTSTIPAIQNIANGDTININTTEYFQTMTLYKGMLILTLNNGYPTDISNINLSLINSINQNIIATFNFPLIASGSVVSDSVSIGGQTIDENLLAILNNMDINASNGPVLINYDDAIITNVNISDIGITEATAIFPEQQLTENLKEHSFDMGGAEIKEIGIKSGTVTVNVLSTLPNGKMIYNIPSLKKNGIPFTSNEMIVPEAINTDLTSFTFNFEGYKLDLTGKEGRINGDTVNTIYTEAYTFIDSTGTLETINNTDSFYSFIEFDITPEYAIGYLGQDTFELGPENANITIFNNITNGNLDLKDSELLLRFENYIGVDADLQINDLSVSNNNTSINVNLDQDGNSVIGHTYQINRASLNTNTLPPINPTITEITITADEMLEILPNNINTHAYIYINPNGQTTIDDFLYPEYPVNASLQMEIPLNFIANELTLIDTTYVNINTPEDVEIDQLFITIQNGLPLDANIHLILIDDNEMILDTILGNTIITAATLNNENIVTQNSITNSEIEYNNFSEVNKIVTIASFNTVPNEEFIEIYNDYSVQMTISGNFRRIIGE